MTHEGFGDRSSITKILGSFLYIPFSSQSMCHLEAAVWLCVSICSYSLKSQKTQQMLGQKLDTSFYKGKLFLIKTLHPTHSSLSQKTKTLFQAHARKIPNLNSQVYQLSTFIFWNKMVQSELNQLNQWMLSPVSTSLPYRAFPAEVVCTDSKATLKPRRPEQVDSSSFSVPLVWAIGDSCSGDCLSGL